MDPQVNPADIAIIQQWWENLTAAAANDLSEVRVHESPSASPSPPPGALSPDSISSTPAAPFSRFELLPGEIRNEVYAYLLSPSLNTSHDVYTYPLDPARNANNNNTVSIPSSSSTNLNDSDNINTIAPTYPTDIYTYRGLTPRKVTNEDQISSSDSDSDDVELVVYSKGNAMATMSRIRIYHEILLTNKRIYKEAHRYLYTICGPVLKVRGIPYTSSLCRLMGRLGFRWFYTRPTKRDIKGSMGTLDIAWKEVRSNDESTPNMKFTPGSKDPEIVLTESQITPFVQLLQILKIRDTDQSQFFSLTFTLHTPQNIYQEPISSSTTISLFQTTVLETFKSFTGTGIKYKFLPGPNHNPGEISQYLKFYNQPIMWIRAEALRIVLLIKHISKQGLNPQYKQRDLVDDFCKWVFIGDLVRNKVDGSYQQLADFRPRMDDLYPVLTLKQIVHICFYNVSKCLFLMVVRNILPEELEITDELGTLKELCHDLDEITSQTMEVETDLGYKEMTVLKPDHIASVNHLQAMICFYCHERGMAVKGIEYFQKCIKNSEGQRKRDFEFLAHAADTWRNDGRVTGELMYTLLQRFPEADLDIDFPDKMESSRLHYEWTLLQRYGYIGSSLTDRFVHKTTTDGPNLSNFPDNLYLEDYKASRFAKKVWLGTGTDELFISDPLEEYNSTD
ncbi:hypothetical protein TWF225_010832 [Orbilia oligospora]|uniref:Uncharacterized protein n=1 Tax=Orbilia oligospora TaxID=2813651 RepID=A0A7C8K615_ORBOL|nr:hypothetical protein TWF751_011230 [Orbilia oligospora]KAF3192966.1 hypothetical protein TWF225_010832 [Orbilia oligospora]KAF3252489.1 hypothetical protein TWF217_007691 [Orbilia oligospora]KAF3271417.1 hypothetical protein TWF128_000021 [Orbilia oligospora]TGJ72795.1 hypothetical protein EYR41_004663 [Orbilia oligospora]